MGTKTVVLVTGATGMCGLEVCRELADAPGIEVRAALHSPDKRSVLPPSVTTVPFDYTDPASVSAALEGVDRMFVATAGGPTGPTVNRVITKMAQKHGIRAIVKLSSLDPTIEPQCPVDLWALEIEAMFRETNIPCTFLQPPWFDQNFTRGFFVPMVQNQALALPFGKGRTGWVDTRDIAAVAAKALLEVGHEGQTYTPTGPEAITISDIAAILSQITGRDVRYHDLTAEQWLEAARAGGQPEVAARAGLALMSKTKDGHAERITDDVERLTGRQARSFEEFAHDHKAALKQLVGAA